MEGHGKPVLRLDPPTNAHVFLVLSKIPADPPTAKILSRPPNVKQGERFSLKCQASGDKPVSFQWLDPQNSEASTDDRYLLEEDGSRLTVRSADYSRHNGLFYCIVTNRQILDRSKQQNATSVLVTVQGKWVLQLNRLNNWKLDMEIERKRVRELTLRFAFALSRSEQPVVFQWWFLLGNHNHQANPHVHQQHVVLATTFLSGLPQPLSSHDLIKAGATQTKTSLLKQHAAGERVDLLDEPVVLFFLISYKAIIMNAAFRTQMFYTVIDPHRILRRGEN